MLLAVGQVLNDTSSDKNLAPQYPTPTIHQGKKKISCYSIFILISSGKINVMSMCTPSKCKAMESKITPEITQNKQHAQPMQRLTTRTEKNEGFSENM